MASSISVNVHGLKHVRHVDVDGTFWTTLTTDEGIEVTFFFPTAENREWFWEGVADSAATDEEDVAMLNRGSEDGS